MKVRIGFGLGTRTDMSDPGVLGALVDDLDGLGFDSVWFSERIGGEAPDPLVAMTWVAARSARLKFGTAVLVVPGRNPVVLAKELATIDRLSGGRLLPAVGLGVADRHEQSAFGVRREDRARMLDEALAVLRRLWEERHVTFHGEFYRLDDVTVLPRPVQDPIDVWLGGTARSELRRVGRSGDGWLPSFCTPEQVADGIDAIREVAEAHGRSVDPEHVGVLVPYRHGPLPDVVAQVVRRRNPDADPAQVVPDGLDQLRSLLDDFVAAGASKFVVVPLAAPRDWSVELASLAEAVLPMQT